jgi:hypothetical protein
VVLEEGIPRDSAQSWGQNQRHDLMRTVGRVSTFSIGRPLVLSIQITWVVSL